MLANKIQQISMQMESIKQTFEIFTLIRKNNFKINNWFFLYWNENFRTIKTQI
jgi:hypothetical protein